MGRDNLTGNAAILSAEGGLTGSAAKMAAFPVSAAAKMAAFPVSAAAKMAAFPVRSKRA